MWAVGTFDLGLSNDAFWMLTLRQFDLLMERYRDAQRRADRRAGEVAIAAYNVARDTKKQPEPWSWLDVFPEHRETAPPMTEDQMILAMDLWARATPHARN